MSDIEFMAAAMEEAAAADDDAHLHAHLHSSFDHIANFADHLEIQAVMLFTGKSFTAKF